MRQEEYLGKVARSAEQALIQAEAVTRCAHHENVLLHNENHQAEHIAYGLASIWLKEERFMREDLEDAIRSVLDRAVKGGCPECARLKDS